MLRLRFFAFIVVFFSICGSALADTLIFVAEKDAHGVANANWFHQPNWFVDDGTGTLVPAGTVPQEYDSAIITGSVDAGNNTIRLDQLILTNSAAITNGNFGTLDLQLHEGSSLWKSTITLSGPMTVAGPGCALHAVSITIFDFAELRVEALPPATSAALELADGSTVRNLGNIYLGDNGQITSGGSAASSLYNTGVLTGSGATAVRGSTATPLLIDNTGVIQATGGHLKFQGGIAWRCSSGSGLFNAVESSDLIMFESPFSVEAGATSLFVGAGTNLFLQGANLTGALQIGGINPQSGTFSAANALIGGAVSGNGTLRVVATAGQPTAVTWTNGVLSCSTIEVGNGALLEVHAPPAGSVELHANILNNSGVCRLWSPVTLSGGALFNNLATGLLEFRSALTVAGGSDATGGKIDNQGTIRNVSSETAAFGAPLNGAVELMNRGLVDVQSGALKIGPGTSQGEFRVAEGAALSFWDGTHVLNSGAKFTGEGQVTIASGLSPVSWFVTGPVSAQRVVVGDQGKIEGMPGASTDVLHIAELTAGPNSIVTNAGCTITRLRLPGQSTFANTQCRVEQSAEFSGTNLVFAGGRLAIAQAATAVLAPAQPGATANVIVSGGAVLEVSGQLELNDGASLLGGPGTPGTLKVTGTVSSSGSPLLAGMGTNPLFLDNSGVIKAESGALRFGDGLELQSSTGPGVYKPALANSQLRFEGPFHVKPGCTALFDGPGTNYFFADGVIDGVAQIGALENGAFLAGNLEVSGSLSGTGTLRITGSTGQVSTLRWLQGTMSLANLEIAANGSFSIAAPQASFSGTINNSGDCTVTSTNLSFGSTAAFNNLASGRFENPQDRIVSVTGGGAFNNSGKLVQSGRGALQFGTSTGTNDAPNFNNTGLVDIQAGEFRFCAGSSSGEFRAASGCLIWLWRNRHVFANASFTGLGWVRVSQGSATPASCVINGTTTMNQFELGQGGSIDGSGTLTLNGAWTWLGGELLGPGSVSISSSGTLTVSGSAAKRLSQRTIDNHGRVQWQSSSEFAAGASAAFNNFSDGLFDLQTDALISTIPGSTPLLFSNGGKFLKSSGAGQTSLAMDFVNGGSVELNAGTNSFLGKWQQVGGTTTVGAGATLSADLLDLQSGLLSGTGRLNASIRNGGAVNPGFPSAALTIAPGRDYVQTAKGTLLAEVTGNSTASQLKLAGSATLDGQVQVHVMGYTPKIGDQFEIVRAGSIAGTFKSVVGDAPTNTMWVARYGATNATIVLTAVAKVSAPAVKDGRLTFTISTAAGAVYEVQKTTSLNPIVWEVAATLQGDGSVQTYSDPDYRTQAFYRVVPK